MESCERCVAVPIQCRPFAISGLRADRVDKKRPRSSNDNEKKPVTKKKRRIF